MDKVSKILIVTQKIDINDSVLGFFHRWILEFAKHCEQVTVICLQKGEYHLPENVKVLSLGKESEIGNRKSEIIKKFIYVIHFYRYIWQERKNYDTVFVHMNPEYTVLGFVFWKLKDKKIALWYTHKSVNIFLRIAEMVSDAIFTASHKSFRLSSQKIIYTGHAVDTDFFKPCISRRYSDGVLRLLTAGRISSVKDIEAIIRACAVLKETWSHRWNLSIVGSPATQGDKAYLDSLLKLVIQKELHHHIFFPGPVSYARMPALYQECDIFLSLSDTGSLDKVVLEAMATGLTVVTTNEAFQSILPPRYFMEKKNPAFIAERIRALANDDRPNMALRDIVVNNHSLERTIGKIVSVLISRCSS